MLLVTSINNNKNTEIMQDLVVLFSALSCSIPFKHLSNTNPTDTYLFNVNNRNTKKVVKFVNNVVMESLLLTLNIFQKFF